MSVRSGAKFSMPGMMETVLNIGLNDESVIGPAEQSGDERFAWDSYRRLLQMFGKTVLGIEGEPFAEALHALQEEKGYAGDSGHDHRGPSAPRRRIQGHRQGINRRRLPAEPAQTARPRRRGRVQLLEHRARSHLPPP